MVEHGLDGLVSEAAAAGVDGALALARTANEAAADLEGARRLDVAEFITLLRMEQDGKLSATQAKTVLAEMLENGGPPGEIARHKGFEALDTDSLASVVAEVVAAHPDEWQRYTAGRGQAGGLLHGEGDESHQQPCRREGSGRGAPPPALPEHALGGLAPRSHVGEVPTAVPGSLCSGRRGDLRAIPTPRR